MTMKVGITYDIRDDYLKRGMSEEDVAEYDRKDTIKSIEGAIHALGYATDPIGNYEQLMRRLLDGDRWDLVFNIAEGFGGLGRESLVPALLDSYEIPYTFSDPLVLALTLHKAMAKRVVRSMGIPTPDFFVYDHDHKDFNGYMTFPLFVKPVAEGTSKGITGASKVSDREELVAVCNTLLLKYKQPVLVENYLSGREFTVGILGTGNKSRNLGVLEVLYRPGADYGVYSFINKERCEELIEYRLVDDEIAIRASKFALAVWKGLGCRDAGRVDLRLDNKGIPNFLEVNPLAGLHPEHSDLCIIASKVGMSYRQLIGEIIESALERYPILRERKSAINE